MPTAKAKEDKGTGPARELRFAVLIDGDNAQPRLLQAMMEEVTKYGVPTVRRIYGDWTSPRMQEWKKVLHTHAFQPMQQFRYVSGKNSTDAAMIIDAMDVLYGANVDAFCLISSDSDYTRLATRLRESGLFVMGIGEKKTPQPLRDACQLFVYTENLATEREHRKAQAKRRGRRAEEEDDGGMPDLDQLLERAFELAEEEDGWAHLGRVGDKLRDLDAGFDPRTYGRKRLLDLIEDSGRFDIQRSKEGGRTPVYIRLRP